MQLLWVYLLYECCIIVIYQGWTLSRIQPMLCCWYMDEYGLIVMLPVLIWWMQCQCFNYIFKSNLSISKQIIFVSKSKQGSAILGLSPWQRWVKKGAPRPERHSCDVRLYYCDVRTTFISNNSTIWQNNSITQKTWGTENCVIQWNFTIFMC